MLPQSGRSKPYDPTDTWDRHPTNFSMAPPARKPPPPVLELATREGVVGAFGQMDVAKALRDTEPFDSGHRFVRTQYKQHADAAIDQNILPHPVISTQQTPATYFLGGPGTEEDREVTGQFVDRLGNTFDVVESRPPPPTKDYTSTAPASSNRNLERLMGGVGVHDRPKKEVDAIVNPAEEPNGNSLVKRERQMVAELKGRQQFFNQAELQDRAEVDTGRDQYNGYNVATPYSSLLHSVEPCWRAKHIAPVVRRPDGSTEGASARTRVQPTERSEAVRFARKPNMAPYVRAGAARIALPYLSEATLRTEPTPIGLERMAACYAHGTNATGRELDVNEKCEAQYEENKRSVAPVMARPADPHIVADANDATRVAAQKSAAFPLDFSASLPDGKQRGDTQRNNDNLIEPTPTRDWAAIQRVLEDFERDGGEDDAEVSGLTRRHAALVAQATPRQDVDHVSGTKLPALPQAAFEGGRYAVSAARSAVRVDRPDASESLPAAAHDISPHGSGRRVHSEAGVPQRNDDSEKQPRARENTVAAHAVPQAPNLSEKDAKMANDPTILHLPIAGSMHGRTTLTEERELVEQPTTNYLPIGVSVHSATTLEQECAKVEQPRMVHVPYDSNIHATPMISKERRNAEHPVMVHVPYDSNIHATPMISKERQNAEHPVMVHIPYDSNIHATPMISKERQNAKHPVSRHLPIGVSVPGVATVDPERAHCEANLKGSAAGGIVGSQWMGVQDDRPPEARSAYAQLEVANATNVVNDAVNMRSTPIQSSARAGVQSTCRLDSMSLPSTPTPMLRAQGSSSVDRSTPTRSMTPGFVPSNARWTPSLQQAEERATPGRPMVC